MRLLNTKTLKLESFIGYRKPKYAILSHTWGHDEVLFEDIQSKSMEQWKNKAGAGKVLKSAEICAWHGIAYIWIDTCCIDKSSSSELSEAINSMFEWYLNSLVCYAYLSDIFSNNGTIPFKNSWWFTRGWTGNKLNQKQLQELLAPAEVQFFDKAWSRIGERSMLAEKIRHITGIDEHVLTCRSKAAIMDCSIHTKMVWASRRNTTREEDRAYSLMGLFDVNMPLLYGEGGAKAFQRLQDEIIKRTNDQTILLHSGRVFLDHLARSPHDFTSLHKFVKREGRYGLTFQNTRDGTDVSLGLSPAQDPGSFWGIITAYFGDDPLQLDQPALALRKCGSGALYERKDKAIYRVRLSDKGQMEVVNRNGL
ncbi:hypothetical protein EV127DRAFT_378870 [Xylaria flabelliformis]|nr:hypothetical protein EV127DRAFT_378870 [Xylaria flabelliformis]